MVLKEKLLKKSSISDTGNQSDFVVLDVSGNFDITEVKGKRFYMTVWTDAYFYVLNFHLLGFHLAKDAL